MPDDQRANLVGRAGVHANAPTNDHLKESYREVRYLIGYCVLSWLVLLSLFLLFD